MKKIDTSTLIRFMNNDLSQKEMIYVRNSIKNNDLIKLKFNEIKNFQKTFKKGIEKVEETQIPNHLLKTISSSNTNSIKKNKNFSNFYKIAASIIAIFAFGSIISLLNRPAFLSENPLSYEQSAQIRIFYKKQTVENFLSKNNDCSKHKEYLDEDNKKVFAVLCNKN